MRANCQRFEYVGPKAENSTNKLACKRYASQTWILDAFLFYVCNVKHISPKIAPTTSCQHRPFVGNRSLRQKIQVLQGKKERDRAKAKHILGEHGSHIGRQCSWSVQRAFVGGTIRDDT